MNTMVCLWMTVLQGLCPSLVLGMAVVRGTTYTLSLADTLQIDLNDPGRPSDFVSDKLQTDQSDPGRQSELVSEQDMKLPYICASNYTAVGSFIKCGDGYCRCKNHLADCSGHQGKLTYVPKLPAGVTTVNFARNKLTAITNDSFFQNITDVNSLILSDNSLSHISPGAFRPIVKLQKLVLRKNQLTYSALSPALSVRTLTLLDITTNPLRAVPDDLFHTFPLPDLETLCMGNTHLPSLNMTVFTPLPQLHYLDLIGNGLNRGKLTPAFLPQLHTLILMYNSFLEYPETCNGSTPWLPNLTWLDMSLNLFTFDPPVTVCLPSLEIFTCLSCFITTVPADTFGGSNFPLLKQVRFSRMTEGIILKTIEGYAFNNSRVEIIVIDSNGIDFSLDTISPDSFANCSNLQRLYITGNDMGSVSEQKMRRLLGNPSVFYLNLQNNRLSNVTAGMFNNTPKLAWLRLDKNKLTNLHDGVFDELEHLEVLDLSSNRITAIRETTFGPATRLRLQHAIVGRNPYRCDCDLRWFKGWLNDNPGLFKQCFVSETPCQPAICDNLSNTTVISFHIVDQACLLSPAVSRFIIASVLLLVLPVFAGTLLYRYRWHIRLALYEAVRGPDDRYRRLQECSYLYDVFVSYDSEDSNWVRSHLISELEERLGLRLCLEERDFKPGVPIVDSIEQSVKSSKKIMVVFSRHFAENQWCQFELRLCHTHVLEEGDSLVVLILEDIPSRDLTPAMMAVMKTVTYITWGDEPEARTSFWGRVRLALSEILY